MKKLFLYNPGMIILSIILFLLTESSWLIYWFRIEEKNFRNDINQAIHAAIQEEAYRINEEDDSFVDFRIENRIIRVYSSGTPFQNRYPAERNDRLIQQTTL